MPNYRPADVAGGTDFFTVNTFHRLPVLTEAPVMNDVAQRHSSQAKDTSLPYRCLGSPARSFALHLLPEIALMAAHHRLAWIHPFLDGNGRLARLHTHLGLSALGLTQGLWSPMRGLARDQKNYYAHLTGADRDREGDYDGCGVLSEKDLVEFITFFMHTCLDQISFMNKMLDIRAFEQRLEQMLASEAIKEKTKSLKVETAAPLAYLATVPSMERVRFKGMTGLAARTAERVMADLFKLGIVTSKTPKGPIELALPMHLFRYLFPRLWPEAEPVNG